MKTNNGKYSGLIIGGGIIGAIIGVVAVLIMIKSAEQAEVTPYLNRKNGVQLGLKIVSLLRSLSTTFSSK
jgi:hypothetical protein